MEEKIDKKNTITVSNILNTLSLSSLIGTKTIRDIKTYAKDTGSVNIPVSLTSSLLKDKNGNINGSVLVAKDLRQLQKYAQDRLAKITPVLQKVSVGDFSERISLPKKGDEFTEHLEALNLMINDFKGLNDAKNQFVSITAHQLRTPLSGIRWAYSMLLSGDFGDLNEQQKEIIKRGDMTVEKLIKIVSDILSVAKMESGDFSYQIGSIELTTFLEEIRNTHLDKAKERKIELTIEIPPKDSVHIKGDGLYLKMALDNIISNALIYSMPEGKVDVSLIKDENTISFKIKDTGIGVPKEEIPKLFKKFFRAPNAFTKNTDGSGLGLYITKSIIDKHEGEITVESEEGKGTTFSIKIPLFK